MASRISQFCKILPVDAFSYGALANDFTQILSHRPFCVHVLSRPLSERIFLFFLLWFLHCLVCMMEGHGCRRLALCPFLPWVLDALDGCCDGSWLSLSLYPLCFEHLFANNPDASTSANRNAPFHSLLLSSTYATPLLTASEANERLSREKFVYERCHGCE
jgi:hypothetical protein